MRIISPFRDYYDSAQGFGTDRSRVYVRKPVVHAEEPHQVPAALHAVFGATALWGDFDESFAVVPIVFCGRVYHAVRTSCRVRDRASLYGRTETAVHYDLADAQRWAAHHERKALAVRIDTCVRVGGTLSGDTQGRPVDADAREWLSEHHAAVLVGDPGSYKAFLTESAQLGRLEFYKVFDAPSAFQELDMYLSGVLAAENRPMVPISDEIRAQQHGFDQRSFRKDPTKRRRA